MHCRICILLVICLTKPSPQVWMTCTALYALIPWPAPAAEDLIKMYALVEQELDKMKNTLADKVTHQQAWNASGPAAHECEAYTASPQVLESMPLSTAWPTSACMPAAP